MVGSVEDEFTDFVKLCEPRLRIALMSAKMRNVKRDPRVSVSIVDPADAYRYVEIRGVVVSFEHDTGLEFITRMAGKYLGLDHYPWHEDGQVEVAVTIKPTCITG